ncbi:MAG: DUF4491 domain-containing protein [Bacteroidia bacterium]|nr:MAG: DUF4491 domain-containing protein [Bacteroidia bacterium]
MEYQGLILGMATVWTIWFTRLVCIKGVYYMGRPFWPVFLVAGIGALVAALFTPNSLVSSIIGVFGFCCLWGIGETIQLDKRYQKGEFAYHPRLQRQRERAKSAASQHDSTES